MALGGMPRLPEREALAPDDRIPFNLDVLLRAGF
jgi:hypothetical protein